MVPERSTVSRKLLTMVSAPPSTLPTFDMAEWTIKMSPTEKPAEARSAFKSPRVDLSIWVLSNLLTMDRILFESGRIDLRKDRGINLVNLFI